MPADSPARPGNGAAPPSANARFVLAVAHAFVEDTPPERAAAPLADAAAGIEGWDGLLGLLERHACSNLAYHLLKAPGVRARVGPPETAMAALRGRYTATLMQVASEPALLAQLLGHLEDAGVRALAIKGIAVGAWLYDDPVLREHVDIDLLVAPASAARTHEVLTGLGYLRAYQPPLYPGELPGTDDYRHRGGGLHVDLSYDPLRLFWQPDPTLGDPFDRCWERRMTLAVGGYGLPTLGLEDQFMQLARHLQFHDYFRVNSFLDVLLLLRRFGGAMDWTLIGREARAAGIHGGIYRTLELAERVHGVRAPEAAWRALRPGAAVRRLHRRVWDEGLAAARDRPPGAANAITPRFVSVRGPHALSGLALLLAGRHRGRTLKYLLQRVLPPAGWLRATYGGALPERSRYPRLLRHHWQQLGRLRARVRTRTWTVI